MTANAGRVDGEKGPAASSAASDVRVAFAGHAAEKGLTSGGTLVLLATLSQSQFGLYKTVIDTFQMVSRIADLGLDTGTMRAVAKARARGDEDEELAVLRGVLLMKVGLAAIVFALGWVVAPFVANRVLDHPHIANYLRLGFAAIFGKQLTGFYKALFSGRLLFKQNALFVALGPAIFLSGLVVAAVGWELSVPICLGLFAVAPLTACLVATIATARPLLFKRRGGFGQFRRVFRFSRWIYATDVLSNIRSYVGTPLMFRLAGSEVAGIYAAAQGMASLAVILSNTLLTVLVPRVSHLTTADEFRPYLRRAYKWMLLMLAVGIPAGPVVATLARPLLEAVKPGYIPALPLFPILLASMLFSVAALPSRAVLYSVHRPQLETVVEVISMVVMIALFYALIPSRGSMGAALAMLCQRFVAGALVVGIAHWGVHEKTERWFEPQEKPAEH